MRECLIRMAPASDAPSPTGSLIGGRRLTRSTLNPVSKENLMTLNPTRTKRMLNLAAVAVAGACLASIPAFAQERRGVGQPQQREDRIGRQTDQPQKAIDKATLPKGIKWSDEPADVAEVRGVIDDVVGAAVIENGFNDVVERFVDQDRNRFGEWMNQGENREFTQFNESAKKFQEAYKAKFNKEFDFDAETAL